MMMAICDSCKKARPARHTGSHGFMAPPMWFQSDTDDPRVKILVCSKICADSIDIDLAIRKAKYLQDKNGNLKSGG